MRCDIRLKNRTTQIRGGYSYIHPETQITIGPTTSFPDLMIALREYCRHQGISVPTEVEVECQICLKQPEDCRFATPRELEQDEEIPDFSTVPIPLPPEPQSAPTNALKPIRMADVVSATKRLGKWLLGGRKKVAPVDSERRARVCLSCPQHVEIKEDGSCRDCSDPIRKAVNVVVGEGRFPSAKKLGACAACGCALEAKVQLPTKYVQGLNETLPDHCWIKNENDPIRP